MTEPYVTRATLEARSKAWLDRLASYNLHRMELNRDRAALLVVDMQRFFLDPASSTYTCGGTAILPNVQKLIAAFRQADRPVIYTRHVHHPDKLDAGIMGWWWEGMCLEGSPESEVHDDLAPRPGEKQILKHRYSAFYNTDLETVLRVLKIEDLVISGIMTNLCCESTARDAYFRDYRIFLPADGTGSVNEDLHLASLMNVAFGFGYVNTVEMILEQINTSL
jgi:nicotinamidase-related amidase